jgi:perosamine synthetase
LAQLERINEIIKKKYYVGQYYSKKLQILSNKLNFPLSKTIYCKNIFWVYGLVIKNNIKITAEFVINALRKKGVECRPFFYPMHLQPIYKKMKIFKNLKYPISETISKRGFYIPSGLGINIKEQNKVIKALINVFKPIN